MHRRSVVIPAHGSPEHTLELTQIADLCLAGKCLSENCLTHQNELDDRTRSTRKARERFAGTFCPLSFQVMTLRPYSQRRHAVAREIPKRQQIGFHGVPSARAQTSRASSGSSHRSQGSVTSMRLMASGKGGGRFMRGGS